MFKSEDIQLLLATRIPMLDCPFGSMVWFDSLAVSRPGYISFPTVSYKGELHIQRMRYQVSLNEEPADDFASVLLCAGSCVRVWMLNEDESWAVNGALSGPAQSDGWRSLKYYLNSGLSVMMDITTS